VIACQTTACAGQSLYALVKPLYALVKPLHASFFIMWKPQTNMNQAMNDHHSGGRSLAQAMNDHHSGGRSLAL
jgi:hypothetical protein